MDFDPLTWALLLTWGGVVALDGASFGQFMVSRPFVAATIAGWVVGSPSQGAVVGLILEVFHLAILPVGAAKYPEGGPPAVAAGAVYAVSDLAPSTLLILVLGAVVLERLGGVTVQYLRQANVRLAGKPGGATILTRHVERRHLAAMALDFGRGLSLTALGLFFLGFAASWLGQYWTVPERVAQVLLVAAVTGMLASAFRLVGSLVWFAAIGAITAVMQLLLST